jgi:hypothetical protein
MAKMLVPADTLPVRGQRQVGSGLGGELVEPGQHRGVVPAGADVDREHAAGVADPEHLLAGELPVHIAGQGGQVGQPADVLLTVEDRLVQVGDAPPVRDVVPELRAQPLGRRAGVGVAPRAERREQLVAGVEGQVAVHHRGHAQRAHGGELDAVPLVDVRGQRRVALLQPGPDGLEGVRPHPVHELVLPVVAADRQRLVVRSDQHRFDPGRAELDPQGGAALGDVGGNVGHHASSYSSARRGGRPCSMSSRTAPARDRRPRPVSSAGDRGHIRRLR